MSLDQELLAQIDKYKEIMQKDPNSREFLTLAELYRKLGVAEEATNILREGLNRHPEYVGEPGGEHSQGEETGDPDIHLSVLHEDEGCKSRDEYRHGIQSRARESYHNGAE